MQSWLGEGAVAGVAYLFVRGGEGVDDGTLSIIRSVRLPRVICVAEVGAALSLCGAAMQGLLKNPLADGSTLGVSTGASLGAALAIAFGFRLPILPFSGAMIRAMPHTATITAPISGNILGPGSP